MDNELFQNLLNILRPRIEKMNTILREAMTAEQCFIATLRYLVIGNNYEDLKYLATIPPQLLGRIIPETCTAIYEKLVEEYIRVRYT